MSSGLLRAGCLPEWPVSNGVLSRHLEFVQLLLCESVEVVGEGVSWSPLTVCSATEGFIDQV